MPIIDWRWIADRELPIIDWLALINEENFIIVSVIGQLPIGNQ
jgi:hypothetical protein